MSQSATVRCLAILEFLTRHPRGLGLTEICAELGIPKSVAHRLLGLLIEQRFVRQDADTSRYALTLKMTLLGLRYYVDSGLSDVSQPILDRLAGETGELARMAIVDGHALVWVGKAQGARYGLRYDPDTGLQVILHATATGKAWLATLPEDEAMRIVVGSRFETPDHFGPNIITDPDLFRTELRATRERGFGLAIEEGEPGMAAVAVVVRDSSRADARAVATLSIAGPITRFVAARREATANLLHAAAAELSVLWPIRAALFAGAAPDAQSAGARQSPLTGGLVNNVA